MPLVRFYSEGLWMISMAWVIPRRRRTNGIWCLHSSRFSLATESKRPAPAFRVALLNRLRPWLFLSR